MKILSTVLFVAFLVALVRLAYRRKIPVPFPRLKPKFCMFPKYDLSIRTPLRVKESTDPVVMLGNLLEPFGFSQTTSTEESIQFSRGSALGDFSIEIAEVNFAFSLPIGSDLICRATYGNFAAFDTGDLWTLCSEIKTKIEDAA